MFFYTLMSIRCIVSMDFFFASGTKVWFGCGCWPSDFNSRGEVSLNVKNL